MSYTIARCKECGQVIHVHKKPGKTVYKNLCSHVKGKNDIDYPYLIGGQ